MSEYKKSIPEQRQEIREAMTRAMNTETVWREMPTYNPTIEEYSYIKAITYDGFEYKGKKTKIFAFVGFPEGASADSPVPGIVLVHGGDGHPFMEWVKLWNDRGYAAIAMETTGFYPNERNVGITESLEEYKKYTHGLFGEFEEEGYTSAPDRSYPLEYTEVSEQWAYHGLSQIILAENILRQDSRVDNSKIGITGISWGGTMTSQIIGFDNRFAFAIPVYGTAYLGDSMRPFDAFENRYVNDLWGAEHNLDDVKMPVFWYAYSDDSAFGVNAYVKSYKHTEGKNEKNTLLMLADWSHSHRSVFRKEHSCLFADWVIRGKHGFVTFASQPSGRDVSCKINIPSSVKGELSAAIYYITEPMSYSKHDKYGSGERIFLDQKWQKSTNHLTVDRETGTVVGTIPSEARGYYINVIFNTDGAECESSSVYVEVD